MGHIHIGYDRPNRITNDYIIKALDLFISVPLVIMEPDNKRKEMYGSAGSFRTTSYGVEYRSTSNYIFNSEELMRWTFNQIQKAIEFLNSSGGSLNLTYDNNYIASSINHKNTTEAQKLINKYNLSIITVDKAIKI